MTTTNTEPAATEPAPFACPNCGSTEQWKADYTEAVWQTVTLADVDGEPQLIDYTGVTGTYDDGSSQDESYQCGCGHVIELGTFEFVPAEHAGTRTDAGRTILGRAFNGRTLAALALNGTRTMDDSDLDAALEDALTNLMHYARHAGIDFDAAVLHAEIHHATEARYDWNEVPA